MQKIPHYYSTSEAAQHLRLSEVGVRKAAKSEEWPCRRIGTANLYDELPVNEYRTHQLRTKLIKKLGWRGRGLYRVDDIDISCPVCDFFAVEWPAPPQLATQFLCLNGHK